MSVQLDMTDGQLKLAVLKLAITLTFGLLIVAFVLSLLVQSDNPIAQIPIGAILVAVAVSILTNGSLALLKIIDWFEERRSKREARRG